MIVAKSTGLLVAVNASCMLIPQSRTHNTNVGIRTLLVLQTLRASIDQEPAFLGGTVSLAGSIPAGQHTLRASSEELPSDAAGKPGVTFDGVRSLANAGSWLQLLRAKLAGSGSGSRSPDQTYYAATDETASLPGTQIIQDVDVYQEPMRRSRSDLLHDRECSRSARRGGELVRPSTAGMVCNASASVRGQASCHQGASAHGLLLLRQSEPL